MTKISVVLPVYNPEKQWLKEAIESILNQTYKDFELLILDDGSKDNIEEIINEYNTQKEYGDKIKFIKLPHKGIAQTLNRGFDEARGEYIARMDADDISHPDRFKIQVEFLDNNPEYSIVGCSIELFGDKKEVWYYPQTPKYFDFIKGCFIAHPSVMLRKKDFEKYNLRYKTDVVCEDYELWSRAIRHLKFYNLQQILLKYRTHKNSLSSNPLARKCDMLIRQDMIDFLTNNEVQKKKIKEMIFPSSKYSKLETIFSIKNAKKEGKKVKVLCLFGHKYTFWKKRKKIKIVKMTGGLGNQMFQYAFGKKLETMTHSKVLYDIGWYREIKKYKNDELLPGGFSKREYCLDIFRTKIGFADDETISEAKELKKSPYRGFIRKMFNIPKYILKIAIEKDPFEYDESLLYSNKTYFEGYFQNPKYLSGIENTIKQDFTFPDIYDKYNLNILNKIKSAKNSVFIHLRRGDYLNLGWELSIDYYKKAINYILNNVENPEFFVFGIESEEFYKTLEINAPTEFIGNHNFENKEDWKDMYLMSQCKHAIIANSTFSWWAAWLGGNFENRIILAPKPFVRGSSSMLPDIWRKIE